VPVPSRRRPWLRHYPPGLPHDPAPEAATLVELLGHRVARSAGSTALWVDGTAISYQEVGDRAAGVGALLAEGRGPVLLIAPNGLPFVAGVFGAILAGRPVAPISPTLTEGELGPVVDEIEPEDVLVAGLGSPGSTFLAGRGVAIHDLQRIDARPLTLPDAPSRPEAPAVLQFTSGTTGGLKAAMMSHRNLLTNAWQNNAWFAWSNADVILGALPLYHTWGLSCVLISAVTAGAPVVLLDRSGPEDIGAAIRRHGATVLYGSATMFDRLLDTPDAAEACRGLRYVKAGAMLVGGRLPERWRSAVPAVPMILGYGLTEASPEVCTNPPGRPKPGTVGVPLPGTEVRIADPVAPGQSLPPDGLGEILVRGPQVMLGYYRRPNDSAAVLLPDGWLRTGDVGRMDAEGYLTVVDRLKDLIKHRGWSVVPAEVEGALLEHPGVHEAVVVGAPHDRDGETVVAFVVGDRIAAAPAALERFLATRLASYKRPACYHWVDAIPRNAVGKPLRRALRARAATDPTTPRL